MIQRWEYLSIDWQLSALWHADAKPPEWSYEEAWLVWPPGADEPERRSTRPRDDEVGEQGWELVTSNVFASAIPNGNLGWPNANTPVWVRTTYKRPITD